MIANCFAFIPSDLFSHLIMSFFPNKVCFQMLFFFLIIILFHTLQSHNALQMTSHFIDL